MSETEWSWQSVVVDARKKLQASGMPIFEQPTQALEAMGFIEDVENLNPLALANMATRHQAWYSYASVELAFASAALKALEEIGEVKLGEKMFSISEGIDGRPVKEVLRSLAIQRDPWLKTWFRKKVEQDQKVRLLEGTVKGLEIRCRALESESIRRMSAQKIEGGR